MTRKPGGGNNAFKHGAFSQDLILPDEKREELEQLHESLIEEWKPKGALEEDTVLTLAQGIWLKRRVERFYHREATWAQEHPEEEELNVMDLFATALDATQSVEDAAGLIANLPKHYREWIETNLPQSKFINAQLWIRRLKSAIPNMITVHELSVMTERNSLRFKAEKAALLRELTAKKISLDERLDARIDKAIKRLAQLKTFKQIIEAQASRVKDIDHHSISDQRQ
jgi:hypothetical protein